MKNLRKGRQGEEYAVNYLIKKKYSILDRNYRYKRAEIDIIAINQDTLVFIEVKNRSKIAFGYPEEFVSEAQEKRILSASAYYLEQQPPAHRFIRFDIIAIVSNNLQFELTHIEDAFH